MIPPIARAIIIIIAICFSVLLCVLNMKNTPSTRARNYLLFISVCFPFLDFSLSNGANVFVSLCYVYLLFNIDVLAYLKKKYLIIILCLAMMLTSILSSNPLISMIASLRNWSWIIFFLICYNAFDTNDRSSLLYDMIKFPIGYVLLFGAIQIFVDPEFNLFYSIRLITDDYFRFTNCFRDSQFAGCGIAMLSIITYNEYSMSRKKNLLFVFLILLYLGLLTGSKCFVLGVIAGFGLNFLFYHREIRSVFIVLSIVVIALLTFKWWIELPIFQRLNNISDSLNIRQKMYWTAAVDIFKENPWVGIGTGNFQYYVENMKLFDLVHYHNGDYIWASQPESGFLLWLDELGVFSILYVMVIVKILLLKGDSLCNISLILIWIIGFISVYNLSSYMMVFLLMLFSSYIVKLKEKTY